ncbi:MAG TPA: hypothetical protein ENI02_00395 [Candidatus Aminicenantes bacterium]|nr:hypothetical protein [Candidatus Aminicenantes bacterium]
MLKPVGRRRRRQSKSIFRKGINPESFRPTKEVARYLGSVYDKSGFINRAIYFYMLLINQPIMILKELKRQRPRLYKFVGRRKFE